jgi:FMN reductase
MCLLQEYRMNNGKQRPHIVGIGGTLHPASTSLSALERTLAAAEAAGATTALLALRDLDLPMFRPDVSLAALGPGAAYLLDTVREADALVWSTEAYHGTLAGVTKNALDYFGFLANDPLPYLDNKVVGVIATADEPEAATHAADALMHVVYALRAMVVAPVIAIPYARHVFDATGHVIDKEWAQWLDKLGEMIVARAVPLPSDRPTFERVRAVAPRFKDSDQPARGT